MRCVPNFLFARLLSTRSLPAIIPDAPPEPPSWASALAACQHITCIVSGVALRQDDCRLMGRVVRKLALLLTALAEENPTQPYSDVDSSGRACA